MKKNNWLVPVLIAAGVALIFFSTWLPQNNFQLNFSQKKLAKVIETTGSVKFQNSEMPAAVEIKITDNINDRDIIRTDSNSEVLIEFNSGGQFRVAEKTEVLIDVLDNGTPVVVIRTGDIFIEKFGKTPSFWIRQNGQIYSAIDYALIDKTRTNKLTEALPASHLKENISQLEIETVLTSKKNDFFRCFGQLIQKNPQASGQVLISFLIEKQGRATKVEISKSDISDVTFKVCLQEVVARTRFRAFSGNAVATVFPLKFE
ncbi:MAG: AgmX/PglI C-terminal domain-containing protein [Bdellovibrionota bacterium]